MAERRALIGLIGGNIQHSLSPAMHEAAGASIGIDVRYHLIDAGVLGFTAVDLPKLLDGVRHLGFAGVNVTHPFKEAVVPCVDSLDAAAQRIGSINTIVVRERKLVGCNTDFSGFLTAWRHVFGDLRPGRVALIGAGGVGRAIGHALATLGADALHIIDVDGTRAEALVRSVLAANPSLRIAAARDVAALQDIDGIINATPVGTYSYPGLPISEPSISAAWVADAIYTPLETRFIAAARSAGATIMTGGELAIGQAVDAFALFFGQPAPLGVMRATFERNVGSQRATT